MKTKYFLAFASLGFLIQQTDAQMLGNGTPSSPYQVTNCKDLQDVQNNLGAYYVLMNDIDCSQTQTGGGPWGATGFTPIGADSANSFTGNFNGHCYAIKNLYINNPTQNYVGIFGFMDSPGKIANLNVINATITGGEFTGVIVGCKHNSTLDTCSAAGYVSGKDYTGGMVGKCNNFQGPNCQITNSEANVVVTGNNFVGGLVGQITTYQGGWALLQNCYALGDVTGTKYVGGLSGGSNTYQGGAPEISNCFATGNVTGVSNVGGLSGWVGPYMGGGSTVHRSFAGGNVKGTNNVGGLIGSNGPTSGGASLIFSTYSRGSVTGTNNVGGLVGIQTSTGIGWGIDTSYCTGLVSGTTNVGGFVGNQTNTSVFDTCFWNNTVNSTLQSIGNLGSYPSIYPSSTTQMKAQATYVGWDFTHTWKISLGNYPTFIPLNTAGNCHFPSTLEAAFNYSTFPACLTDSVQFTDQSMGGATSWNWNFGDPFSGNNTSTLKNPAHLFSSAGTFTVTMIATAGVNTDTIATPVVVTNCITGIQKITYSNCDVTVYPNPGNGVFNFTIVHAPANARLEIYNVLGEKLLENILSSGTINTTINLSNQAKGVYFYKLISTGFEKNGKLVVE